MSHSAGSQAKPTRTYTGSTADDCASCAASTVLSSPDESRTSVRPVMPLLS